MAQTVLLKLPSGLRRRREDKKTALAGRAEIGPMVLGQAESCSSNEVIIARPGAVVNGYKVGPRWKIL